MLLRKRYEIKVTLKHQKCTKKRQLVLKKATISKKFNIFYYNQGLKN